MRKPLLLMLAAILATACMDKNYDLSNIETDDIAIGDETSEFKIPLATIRVGMDEITGSGAQGDIREMFEDADTWLPTTLPGGADYLDLTRLHERTYTDPVFDALFAEMDDTASGKLDRVTDLVLRKYRTAFAAALGVSESQLTADYFKEAYRSQQTTSIIRSEAKRQSLNYLNGLDDIAPLDYDLGHIDLSGDVVDMLVNNLDPEGTTPYRNTLHLYGRIESGLPVSLRLAPAFSDTGVRFETGVEPDSQNRIDEVQIFEPDLRTIVAGTAIGIPVHLEKYYPGKGFSDRTEQIMIRLSLVKRGALNL